MAEVVKIYTEGNSFVIERESQKEFYFKRVIFQEVLRGSGNIVIVSERGNVILKPTLFSSIKDINGSDLGVDLNSTLISLAGIVN